MAGYYDRDRNPRTPGTEARASAFTAAGTMNHPMTHHGNVAEYQVSGIPFFYTFTTAEDTVHTITFPYVTQWIQIILDDNKSIKVGYTKAGLGHDGGNYVEEYGDPMNPVDTRLTGTNYVVFDSTTAGDLPNGAIWRMKTNQLAIISDAEVRVSIVAGLTSVLSSDFPDISSITGCGSSLLQNGSSLQDDDVGP